MAKRLLLLEDGTVFEGEAFGADVDVTGELVFTTAMTGYQETVTNLSYTGKIVTFTFPSIGNTGISREDYESIVPTCQGVVLANLPQKTIHWRSQMSLDEFLTLKRIPGIAGIDTRMLVKKLSKQASMRATMANPGDELSHLADQLRATVLQKDHVKQISTKNPYPSPGRGRSVLVLDLGLKHSILRELDKRDCNVVVLPYRTSAEIILQHFADGLILSNGPGDPRVLAEIYDTLQTLQGKIPLFGIGLGHQLLALTSGASLEKLPFGHRGNSQAVREVATGRLEFTSHNHDYVVSRKNLPKELLITHEHVGDGSIEGLRHRYLPIMSVQFYPGASPGAQDSVAMFDEFMEMIDAFREKKEKG